MLLSYTFALPSPFNGQTHVHVSQHIVDGNRINIHGEYGTMAGTPKVFTPAEGMFAYGVDIRGDELVDLIDQANAAGRPATLPDHDMRTSDIVAHLEEDPLVRRGRIDDAAAPPIEDPPVE